MPEIPEVTAFGHYIDQTCLHKTIAAIQIKTTSLIKNISAADFKKELAGKKFSSTERRGKYLIILIEASSKKLILHFGLTGSVAYTSDTHEEIEYTQVAFIFADGSVLHWINKRKFGRVWLIDDPNTIPSIKTLGPDPLQLSEQKFSAILKAHPNKNIKACLIDQTMVSGIGDEYSDEILFQSRINPEKTVADLSSNDLKTIYKNMQSVLKFFIKFREKTIGKSVPFPPQYLQAHRHTDHLCPLNSKHHLTRKIIAGRPTYFCPIDQS